MLQFGELFVLHELYRQGLSIKAIAKRSGLDRKTVRKYLHRGLEPPVYGPRQPRPSILARYHDYLDGRLKAYPELSGKRLHRELQALGFTGGYTMVTDYLRQIRPRASSGFEHRFETPAGQQAQVDFAQFKAVFSDEPQQRRVVWLFSMVLGYSRYLYARFVARQDLQSVIGCHIEAFSAFGGVAQQILYDRMKTAVLGETADSGIVYNAKLLDLAAHYGFTAKACAPYRAKTKGKVERPFRYVRQDFFLGREFGNLADLNQQLSEWLEQVANARCHGTTQRIVKEAMAEERATLQPLPALAYRGVLKLERRVTRDGMVSVQGNLYSVPDRTRRRLVEVQVLADKVRLFEAGELIAAHARLEGKGQRAVAPDHRQWPPPGQRSGPEAAESLTVEPAGMQVSHRSLEIYAQIGQALALEEGGE